MNPTDSIQRFYEVVNDGLSQGKDNGRIAYEQLIPTASGTGQKSLLDRLYQNYSLAQEPDTFSNVRIWNPDERFEQCYELMHITFDEAELEPREIYLDGLELLKKGQHPFPPIIIGRFWHVSGPQQYDVSGQLRKFSYDPLVMTDSIAGLISGNYMRVLPQQKESIGAIGHLATRSHFRRRGGHGTALLQAFEQEVKAIATARGENLQLIVLEAQEDSTAFWAKQGYRWPAGSRYFQPPLEFDPLTGERLHDEVPELLMVKILNDPSATFIDSRLLRDTVYTLYQNWCLSKTATGSFTKEATQRAKDYVLGKVFTEFIASLPSEGELVPLQDPSDTEF
jgi:ribosomal protein S18 acetylase RimI-like enzyme